jgi:hypothetical protein
LDLPDDVVDDIIRVLFSEGFFRRLSLDDIQCGCAVFRGSFSVTDSAAISLTSPGLITNDGSVRGLGCGGVTGDRTIASSSPVAVWFSIEGDLSGTSGCCLLMAAGSADLPPTETGADGTVPPQAATPRSRQSTGQ